MRHFFLASPLFFSLLLLRITVNGSNESIKRVRKIEQERGENKCFKADINYSTNFVDLARGPLKLLKLTFCCHGNTPPKK